mmetsp:Transcript_53937/g.142011  ORF Transcript_53937/g.142011 Transcript_53937/m.142011 type:complete len:208 (-) Transcript_53937:199-822(-)
MRVTIEMMPASANSAETSAARRTDSARSAGVKPRSRVSPVRRLSPSMLKTFLPSARSSRFSNALQIVVLPAPDSPVIHSVTPFWPSTLNRLFEPIRHSCPGLHSMMFFIGRPSIAVRWRPATSPSASFSGQPGGVGVCGHSSLQSGHVGQDAAAGHTGHALHWGHCESAPLMASVMSRFVSGCVHTGHLEAATSAITSGFAQGTATR